MVTNPPKPKIIISFVLLSLITLLFSVNPSLAQGENEKDPVEELYSDVWESSWNDADVAREFVIKSLDILRGGGTHPRMSRFAIYVARESTVVFGDVIQTDSLRKILNLCEKIVSERDSSYRFLAMVLNAKGVTVTHQGLYDSAYKLNQAAIEYGKISFKRSLSDRDRANILGTLVISYTNMGHALFSTTDFEDPLERRSEIGPKLVRIFQTADSLSSLVIQYAKNPCYSPMMQKVNLANVYGHYYPNAALSEKYYEESIKILLECNNTEKLCQVYNSIAYTKLKAKDTIASIAAARKAIAHSSGKESEFFNRWARHESNFILSTIFFGKREYDSAIHYGNAMLIDSASIKKPGDIAKISSLMADYYLQGGQINKSVKYLEVSRDYLKNFNLENQQRSIIDQEKSRMIAEIVKRIEKVEEGIGDRVRFQWLFWTCVILAATIFIVAVYIALRKRQEKFDIGFKDSDLSEGRQDKERMRVGFWNRILIIAFFILPGAFASAQSKRIQVDINIDSVYDKLYERDWNDKKAMLDYFVWGLEVAKKKPEHSIAPRLANYLSRSAVILYSEMGKDSVFNIIDLCFSLVKRHDSITYYMPNILRNKGIYYQQHGNYDSAFIYHQKAIPYHLEAYKQLKREDDWIVSCLASAYSNMGHALFCTTDPSDGPQKKMELGSRIVKYFMLADSLNQEAKRISGDSCYYGTSVATLNIANIYGHYYVNTALSERYFKKALDQITQCRDTIRLAGLYNTLAWTRRYQKDTLAAIDAAEKCIYYSRLKETSGNAVTRVEANHLLSNIFFNQKNYPKLIIHANQIFDDTVYVKKPFAISLVSAMMAETYLKRNDVKKSLAFLQMSRQYLAKYTSQENQQVSILSSEEARKVKSVVDIIDRVQKDVDRREGLRDVWVITAFTVVILLNGLIVYLLVKRKRALKTESGGDGRSPITA